MVWLYQLYDRGARRIIPQKTPHGAGLDDSGLAPVSAGYDLDEGTLFRTPFDELYRAVTLGEQGVVPAATDIAAGVEPGAALAHQYIACQHRLAAKALDAESLRF
jgi:hypothetical protein